MKHDFDAWSNSLDNRLEDHKNGKDFKERSTVRKTISREDLDDAFNTQELKRRGKSEKENRSSNATAATMMIFFGLVGLAMGGLEGAILGAIFGFGITAIVLGAKDGFK